MEIDALLVATILAAVLGYGVVLVWMRLLGRPKPQVKSLKLMAFVISVGTAYYVAPITLPPFPMYGGDPVAFAIALGEYGGVFLASAVVVFKAAQLLYDEVLQRLVSLIDAGLARLGIRRAAKGGPGLLRLKRL